jgi:hypothetical protein
MELTVRAMRKAAEIPRTTNNDSAYNNISMENKLSLEVRVEHDDSAHIGTALMRWRIQ